MSEPTLIIDRRIGEPLFLNNNIKVIYLGRNRFGQCKFGIEAPKEISIHREEVQQRINLGIEKPVKLLKNCNKK